MRSLAFDATTPLQLSSGETLAPLTIAFETYGALNAKGNDVAMEELVLAYERLELA